MDKVDELIAQDRDPLEALLMTSEEIDQIVLKQIQRWPQSWRQRLMLWIERREQAAYERGQADARKGS